LGKNIKRLTLLQAVFSSYNCSLISRYKFSGDIGFGKRGFIKKLIDMAKQAQTRFFPDNWNYFVFLLDNWIMGYSFNQCQSTATKI